MFKLIKVILITFSLLIPTTPPVLANSKKSKEAEEVKKPEIDIRELALPSETQNIGKSGGAIFYSPSIKDKVLMPVHFWGEISRTGLHFIPMETSLVQGLSMAGGPKTSGVLSEVKVTRRINQKLHTKEFDLEDGGEEIAHDYKLQPGDTVFVKKSNYLADRSYYTSLIGVVVTTLSAILIYRQVRRDNAGQQ